MMSAIESIKTEDHAKIKTKPSHIAYFFPLTCCVPPVQPDLARLSGLSRAALQSWPNAPKRNRRTPCLRVERRLDQRAPRCLASYPSAVGSRDPPVGRPLAPRSSLGVAAAHYRSSVPCRLACPMQNGRVRRRTHPPVEMTDVSVKKHSVANVALEYRADSRRSPPRRSTPTRGPTAMSYNATLNRVGRRAGSGVAAQTP